MTLKEFTEGIKLIQKFDSLIYHLNDLKIDVLDSSLTESTYGIFNLLMEEYFTVDGLDTISWWLYDSCPKIIYFEEETLFGKYKKELKLDTIEDLWNYLNSDKIYLKNGSTSN